ncbi:DUF2914 domain-containing protein [Pseudoalteromonas atlantica]|uniref:DUF2914 domain-containing protein n=1 Tax=Pseudoalteromonas atlantica TaxID=288 RepID=UPI003736028A
MSQKIVITASMNKAATDTLPSVTYQWHWRRIATAALFVSVLLVVLVYSLMGSVNAEQNDLSTDNMPQTSSQIKVEEAEPVIIEQSSTTLSSNDNAIEVSEPITVSNLDTDSPQMQVANEVKEEPQVLSELQREPQEIAEPGVETPLPSNNQESFAETAHIASVAIGAKIDTDKVSRAVLTRKVVEREPVNVFKADVRLAEFTDTLTFFSELKNLQGQSIRHIWRYDDQVMASIELKVTTPRYRTYSNKHILPEQIGYWRVDVVDEQDHLLAQKEFRILAD